jgi:hypothetical protein
MITQEYLRTLFYYKDGKLYWKYHPSNKHQYLIGTEASSFDGKYYQTRIDGKKYRTHRLIFMYYFGYMPTYIDHIDNNPLNNIIENLRECNLNENSWNVKIRRDNTSGVKGISWSKEKQKWSVYINKNDKRFRLGYFADLHQAKEKLETFRKSLHEEFFNNG